MGKALFSRLASYTSSISSVALLVIFGSNLIADDLDGQMDSIVLTDDSKNSIMKQDTIIGCDDSLKIDELKCSKERTPADRDRDIDEIKAQLSEILKQLAELKKEKDARAKDSKLNTIKKSIKNLTIDTSKDSNVTRSYSKPKEIKVVEKRDDYVVVEVQSGESLSKYAQKYYGDSRKYYRIYRANMDKISKDLQIYIGDKLIVPTSDSYKYKEFNSTKEIKKEKITKKDNLIKESNKTTPNFVDIKKLKNRNSMLVKKLDEAIYVGDEDKEIDNSDFLPLEENISWVETKVPKGFDIYQLAQKYYGDKNEYYNIYNANRNLIKKDLKIKEGEVLKIPITDKFQEKPEYLGIK